MRDTIRVVVTQPVAVDRYTDDTSGTQLVAPPDGDVHLSGWFTLNIGYLQGPTLNQVGQLTFATLEAATQWMVEQAPALAAALKPVP